MVDSGKAGGMDQAVTKGMGWRLRMALAAVLRLIPFAAAMVLMVILWGACGGGSLFSASNSSSSPTSTSTKTPGSGAFLYVTENATGLVAQYSRNPSTGALSTNGTVSAGNANGPIGIGTASSSSQFVYVVNSATTTSNVFQYSLNTVSGVLTALGNPVSAGSGPQWVAVTPNGQFAYVTNLTGGSVSQYTIGSGALTANSPANVFTDLAAPYGAAANSNFLFVTDQTNEDVVTFPISSNGTLQTPLTPIPLGTGASPGPIIIDASTDFAFATDTTLGLLYAFGITNGGLSPLHSYPIVNAGTDVLVGLTTVITQPDGNEYIYIASPASNSIWQYQVTAGTGVLTLPQQYTTFKLSTPWGMAAATDPTSGHSYLYVTSRGSGAISVFAINPSSGSLTAKGSLVRSATSQPLFPLIAY